MSTLITKQVVVDAILYQKEHLSSDIKFTKELMNVLYKILYAFYVQDNKYVLLQAPTGTGKSIIGFVLSYCVSYIEDWISSQKIDEMKAEYGVDSYEFNAWYNDYIQDNKPQHTYYLTSSKILQGQIYDDIHRFSLHNMKMLKGTSSYPCTFEVDEINRLMITTEERVERLKKATYENRRCKNETQPLDQTKFAKCYQNCPYLLARQAALQSKCAVLNYSYYLTVMNSAFRLFEPRKITICDEAHKLNEIVDNMFTCMMNVHFILDLERFINKLHTLRFEFENEPIFNDPDITISMKNKFLKMNSIRQTLIDFMKDYQEFMIKCKDFLKVCEDKMSLEIKSNNTGALNQYLVVCKELNKRALSQCSVLDYYNDALHNRPDDIFIRCELPFQAKYYIVEVKDLNESHMLQEKFIKHTSKVLFMSATMGNMTEFADTYGLKHEECCIIKIKSSFDFSTSPIYLCSVGNLKRDLFEQNIGKCLEATVQIIKQHPNEKGLVHTHTFGITRALRQIAYNDQELCTRLHFYETAAEKEQIIRKMKKDNSPIVICGPSLVEGIDLKYDLGRFNILIKTPYSPINDYVLAKMKYCSWWYRRMAKQAIIQSIGRTNRAIDDQSTTYLIDSGFYALIFELDDDTITPRVQKLKINIPEKPAIQQSQTSYNPYDNPQDLVNKNDMSDFDSDLPF